MVDKDAGGMGKVGKRMDHGIEFHEDMSQMSNLPREVMHKYWPKSPFNNMGEIDDLFEGVNRQMNEDHGEFNKIFKPKKY